ncbi:MAG: PHP domain-containing protein [Clostridia bacterium]|nr:PHP domain-containing protein [Clostridia bacterium]
MKYANLHLHSYYSDAGFSPEQLVVLGKALGYRALALTDHETDGGYKDFAAACEREGIDCMRGVEFYGREQDCVPHLTALNFDPDCPVLRNLINRRCEEYMEDTRKAFERGVRRGIIDGITWDDVMTFAYDGAWICEDTVIRTFRIKKLPVPENIEQRVFRGDEVKAMRNPKPSAKEVIEAVRAADGIIALAHPNHKTFPVLKELLSYGLNGIELSHAHIPEDILTLAEEAAEAHKLYRCGGTDHSGPMSSFGGENAIPVYCGVTEEEYETIKYHKLG